MVTQIIKFEGYIGGFKQPYWQYVVMDEKGRIWHTRLHAYHENGKFIRIGEQK